MIGKGFNMTFICTEPMLIIGLGISWLSGIIGKINVYDLQVGLKRCVVIIYQFNVNLISKYIESAKKAHYYCMYILLRKFFTFYTD